MKKVKDPVCGMEVEVKKAEFKSEYNGNTYYFCSSYCKEEFEREPTKYFKRK